MDALTALDTEETRLLTELTQVRTAKVTLRRVLGVAEPPHGPTVAAEPDAPTFRITPKVPPGKPKPRPRRRGPGAADGTPLAVRVARHLCINGPLTVRRIAEAPGMAGQPRIYAAMATHPAWFRKTGDSQRSPWAVTEAGRAAAVAESVPTSATSPTSGPASEPTGSSSCTPTPSPA